jgi:predicted nucleic acid-binding Zn ribbon protein
MVKKTKNYCKNCGKITEQEFCSEICEKVYNEKPKGAKPLEAIEQQNKKQKYCEECGKPIPNDLTFCSAKCIREYRFKKEHPQERRTFVKAEELNMDSETPFTDYVHKKEAGKKAKPKQRRHN